MVIVILDAAATNQVDTDQIRPACPPGQTVELTETSTSLADRHHVHGLRQDTEDRHLNNSTLPAPPQNSLISAETTIPAHKKRLFKPN